MDADELFEKYATNQVTIISGTLMPNQAGWLDQEVYPSLEAASAAARTNPKYAGKVVQVIVHIQGGLDKPLSSEELLEVLRPRRDYHSSVKTGLRLARDQVEPLGDELTDIVTRNNYDGKLNSMGQFREMRDTCVITLRAAGEVLVRYVIARKGDNAKNRRDEIAAALEELKVSVTRRFHDRDGSQSFGEAVTERGELEQELERVVRRILLDFDEGVYHMGDDQKPGSISIGSIGQMAGHIGSGNSGNVRAEQSQNDAELFANMIAATNNSPQVAENREAILAAIAAMQAEQGKSGLARTYGLFMSTIADHMQVYLPFMPALAALVANAAG